MMKNIVLGNGEVRLMTFEETLSQFDNMIQKKANETMGKVNYNSGIERDDILQELRFQCWEAYKRYNGKNAFSTFLHFRLKLGASISIGNFAEKRKNNGILSLDFENSKNDDNENVSFEGMLGVEDLEFASVEFNDFVQYLEKILSNDEQLMLYSLLNKKEFSVQDLADEWGVSRTAANNRVRKFREKMVNILKDSNYLAC